MLTITKNMYFMLLKQTSKLPFNVDKNEKVLVVHCNYLKSIKNNYSAGYSTDKQRHYFEVY